VGKNGVRNAVKISEKKKKNSSDQLTTLNINFNNNDDKIDSEVIEI
jgi:hypothetical protein